MLDVVRVVTAAFVGMGGVCARRLIGRTRRPSWTFTHEVMLGAYRGTWSMMPVIGAARWREVGSSRRTPGTAC